MQDSEIFGELEKAVKNSTCLKTGTAAAVIKNGVTHSLSWNLCAPNGIKHGDRPENCPRMETKTGTDYELCNPVHAEVLACLNIRPDRDPSEVAKYAAHLPWTDQDIRKAFSSEEMQKLNGAMLYLRGHYWACKDCLRFMSAVGIPESNLIFDKSNSEEVKQRYEKAGLH